MSIIPKGEEAPEAPKFPTSDVAYEMARSIATSKKRKKKKKGKPAVSLDLGEGAVEK